MAVVIKHTQLNGNCYKCLDIPGFSAGLVSWVSDAGGATVLDLKSKVVPGANSNLEIHDRTSELIRMR